MTTNIASLPTLATAIWPIAGDTDRNRMLLRAVVLALAGSILMTLSAKIQIPFWPVPLTMQTFVVLVLGMAYGWRLGAATMMLYLVEGACGLPVFAGTPEKGIGLAYMVGPTGGYLAGFVLAAALCGWLAERGWDRSIVRVAAAMIIGHALILGLGTAWLSNLIGLEKGIQFGLAPFWSATIFKTALAMAALPLAWHFVGKRR